MSDYIKREDAINKITIELSEVDIYSLPKDAIIIGLTNDIKNIPSANGEERKRGEWIKKEKRGVMTTHTEYHCSECQTIMGARWNFCPNCGADMRGAE